MTAAPATDRWTARVRRLTDPIPRDLVGLVLATVLAAAVVRLDAPLPGTLRALLGLGLVLVAPGYALLAALFPAGSTRGTVAVADERGFSPGTGERLVLSVGVSLAVLPPLALGIVALSLPLEAPVVALALSGLVVALALVATARRLALSPAERYRAPSLLAATREVRAWIGRGNKLDTALTAALTLAVLLAVAGLGYGLAGPRSGASYTSASLLTATEDGTLVASNYPTTLTAGQPEPLVLRVENARQEPTDYSVAVELQRVDTGGTGAVAVTSRERLATASASVAPGDEWLFRHTVAPTTTGEGLRLTYYVYAGEVPDRPTAGGAAARTHLWVTVTAAGGE